MRQNFIIHKLARYTVSLMLVVNASILHAEDISKTNTILCASVSAVACLSDGDCISAVPWELNIPNFIKIDLQEKLLSTTEASGERRETVISNLRKDDGLIFLQGIEAGRAFSFVIDEDTGMSTLAVARRELTVTVFGSCTPIQ